MNYCSASWVLGLLTTKHRQDQRRPQLDQQSIDDVETCHEMSNGVVT